MRRATSAPIQTMPNQLTDAVRARDFVALREELFAEQRKMLTEVLTAAKNGLAKETAALLVAALARPEALLATAAHRKSEAAEGAE